MLLLFSLTALFIAWIWVDYYRLIDIYEVEELKYFILTFVLGALSTTITLGINFLFLDRLNFDLNGNLLNDILFCTFEIGMLEEFSKLIPFLIMLKLFKKHINEPIDYISYMCVAALGFSAAENIIYFSRYGAEIISGRAILSSLGHMMFAAFTAYGIILYRYKKVKLGFWIIIIYFFLGSFAHGIYDFWLMHYSARALGYFITILFFLQMVSSFATMLNNALNNSEFFSYKIVIDSTKVGNRLLLYYFIVFVLQMALLTFQHNLSYALSSIGFQTFFVGIIIFICSARLSRFKLIRGRWFPLRLEFPFHIRRVYPHLNSEGKKIFSIRGEGYNEVYLNKFYDEYVWLNPLSRKSKYLKESKLAFIEKKLFLKGDETYYLTKLYLDSTNTRYEYVLLKPKLIGKMFTSKRTPIIAILKLRNAADFSDLTLDMTNFIFVEWAYPKLYENWEKRA